MAPKTTDAQPVAKKAASKTRASKTVEKAADETPVTSYEVPGYKALSEEEMRRDMAEAAIYAQAGALVPSQMRGNAGDMYILMQIAKHLNVPVISVLRGFSFIGDKDVKPTMTAQFMAGLVRNAGHTLREQWDAETSTATAVIIRKDDPQFEHVAVWDEEKARVAGLWESTPTWVQYPKAMLMARATSEVCRQAVSEVLMGFSYVPEEFQSQESASRVLDMREQVKHDMDRLHLSNEKAADLLDGIALPGIPVALMTPRELEDVNARIGVIEYERDKDKIDEVRERIQKGRDKLNLSEGAFAEIVRRNVRPGRGYDTMNLREAEQVLDVLLRQAKKSGIRSGQRQAQPASQAQSPQSPAPQQQAPAQPYQSPQQPRPQAQQGYTQYMPAQPQEAPQQRPEPAQQPQQAPAPAQESYGLYDESQRPEQYPSLGSQNPQGTSGPMAMIQRAMQAQGIPMEELPIVLTYALKDNNRAANVDALTMDDMTDVRRDIQQYAAETSPLPEPTAELPFDGDAPADKMDDLEASYSENGGEVNDDSETWNEGWPETAKPGGGAN
mgnify:CR=1 FL=1